MIKDEMMNTVGRVLMRCSSSFCTHHFVQMTGKRPANSILFVCTAFSFEFSALGNGPAVLGV